MRFLPEGEAVIEFYAADTPATYRIVEEGVTGTGKIISFTKEILIESSAK